MFGVIMVNKKRVYTDQKIKLSPRKGERNILSTEGYKERLMFEKRRSASISAVENALQRCAFIKY